jgi:putative spermidine/putrescine transport system ATP-binding protein
MNRIPGELQDGGMVTALDSSVPVRSHGEDLSPGPVDVLVRPEGLAMQVIENGNGIVTTRTFLGSVTRVGVLLSGDVTVQIDRPSSEAATLAPGTSVSVSLPMDPVLIAPKS